MKYPRLTWAAGLSSLFMVFPFVCMFLVPVGGFVALIPLFLYYLPPSLFFGEPWFEQSNMGPSPTGPIGYGIAALVWGSLGAVLGLGAGAMSSQGTNRQGDKGLEHE